MNDYIDQCTIEEVTTETIEEMGNLGRTDLYFLPHRAVYDPTRVSTKCRIVFDASAKSPSGFSLNDSLLPGPPLQQAIVAVELRFRTRRVALIGDISKMFLQIEVDPIDRQYLRFLWRDPDDPKATTKVYQFRTLIFGAADSPFQAISCLQRLVKDRLLEAGLTTFEKRACDTILKDTYVDDVTTGGDSVEEAFTMYRELCKLLDRGHFKIHKWATNSPELLKRIPKESRAPTTTDEEESSLFLSEETSSLGIRWDPSQDTFIFRHYCSMAIHNDDTKTSVASLLARPFDPLGLISPFILLARKILKGTFEEKINWKSKLSPNLQQEWHRWLEMLPELKDVTFPRHVEFNDSTELHVFGDASANMGHGVAAYARTFKKEENRYESTLLFAKSKINPTKDISVPRLELVAALLCAKIADMIREELNFPKNRIFCYSDSETTLWWLTKKPNSLLPFVSNRVQKIQGFGYVFQYVSTQMNPADIASRGCAPSALKRTLWTQGPNFLRLSRKDWKIPKVDFSKVDKLQEVKKQFVYSHLTISKTYEEYPQNMMVVNMADYYGDHDLLLRKTMLIMEIVDVWKSKVLSKKSAILDPNKISHHKQRARLYWIKQAQFSHFAEEIENLKRGQDIPRHSKLLPLNPQLDERGVLRVHGRLVEAPLLEFERFPIILPKGHGFVSSLILKTHLDNQHSPVDWTHFHLRQQYWIMSSRLQIRSVLRKCLECQKSNARRGQQIMAPLPTIRLKYSPPFTKVGVDYTAKFQVKMTIRARNTHPCYMVIFTCLITRAVHTELVLSNEAEDFLLALRRMMSVRGVPVHLYSDNGLYFKKADKELKETVAINNEIIKDAADKYEFKWSYSTELHSAGGGIWERAVKLIKVPMRKLLDKSEVMTYVDFLTLMKDAEAQVNDRPLLAVSEEAFDVITPSMLCLGRRIRLWQDFFSETECDDSSEVRLRWEQRQNLSREFEKLWTSQYLTQLHARHRWFSKHPNLKIGDLVLIEEQNRKQYQWPLGRVFRIIKGPDGQVRTVLLRSKNSRKILKRSIHEIFPLEACRDNELDQTPSH